jgi:anti-anti-sigma regulatory factor
MSQRFLTTVTGRSPGDHVCWPFHGIDEYVQVAREYVAEGLDRHQLVAFVKATPQRLEHTIVSEIAQVGRPAEDRRPVLNKLTVLSRETSPTSAQSQIDRMTRAAVAEGYTGLWLLTDVSDLVRGPEGRRKWIRSEHLIDRYALDNPLTALCGYDIDDLGEEIVAEAARMHPFTRGAPSPFLLPATDADGGLALIGDVDMTSADDLYHALMLIGPEIPSHVTVDMSELEFIDHRSLLALDRAARSLGVTMTLVNAEPLTEWLVDTLELRSVRKGTVA